MDPFVAIWTNLDKFEPIWTNLDPIPTFPIFPTFLTFLTFPSFLTFPTFPTFSSVCKDMAMGLNMPMSRMMILVIRGFVGRGGMLLLIIVGKFLGFV